MEKNHGFIASLTDIMDGLFDYFMKGDKGQPRRLAEHYEIPS